MERSNTNFGIQDATSFTTGYRADAVILSKTGMEQAGVASVMFLICKIK